MELDRRGHPSSKKYTPLPSPLVLFLPELGCTEEHVWRGNNGTRGELLTQVHLEGLPWRVYG